VNTTDDIDRYALEGHDRDCAHAMMSQVRLRTDPIDDIQVRHLLAIGYRAGIAEAAEHGRRENAMGHREAAAFLHGRAAVYTGWHAKAVRAFALEVHAALMSIADRIEQEPS
jgi:hypothetical protein